MKDDDFGDRMKLYENQEAGRKFIPLLPIIARIDGRSFHTFTKGLNRPYDERLTQCMIETTKYLVEETNACIGYTQSDEISLAWYSNDIKSTIWFDGRIAKMTSQLAAQATIKFFTEIQARLPEYASRMPTFDARVWQVPTLTEGSNVFVWREQDAVKNSISMAAQSVYSHKVLMGKNGSQKQDMLMQKGINWNEYPAFFKRGTYVQRRKLERKFTTEELDKLPPKHLARTNPDLVVTRSVIDTMDFQPLTKMTNRNDVIFLGKDPIYN